jgi:hypothetical protein
MTSPKLHVVHNRLQTITRFPEASLVERFLYTIGIRKFFIAGGYFRDKEHGQPFKDLDIFIPGYEPPGDDVIGTIDDDYKRPFSFELTFEEDIPLNFIRLRGKLNLVQVLTRFDICFCQIGLRAGETVATQAYLDDAANKTLTITRETSSDHIERIQTKYPDFRLIPLPAGGQS